MLEAEIRLLDGAEDVVATLASSFPIMLITKGDQFEQERKVDRSGLARYFKHIDIVSEKSIETYDRLLDRYGIHPSRFLMVGNSLRSDIVPVVSLGGQAAYIPYDLTWEHETILAEPLAPDRYHHVERLNLLPGLIRELDSS
jgi:putative hydrolase of the HAD superfamily